MLSCLSHLELLDEMLYWKIIAVFVLTECGVMLSPVALALMFRLSVSIL